MKLFVFAVFDTCSGVYDRPMCARSEGEMLRAFTDLACNAEHPIGAHPEHYKLFSIGVYDDNNGELINTGSECIASAHELVADSRRVDVGAQLDLVKEVSDGS